MSPEFSAFSPDYWQAPAQSPLSRQSAGKIPRTTRRQSSDFFRGAITNLIYGGVTQQIEAGELIDWNGFDPGTVLLIDEEERFTGLAPKQNDISAVEEANMSAKGTLLKSARLAGQVKKLRYYRKASYDEASSSYYLRYVSLSLVCPTRKTDNAGLDMFSWIQYGLEQKSVTFGRSYFYLPRAIGETAVVPGAAKKDHISRLREVHVCYVGSLERKTSGVRAPLGRTADNLT